MNSAKRVVVDTNIWISAIISENFNLLFETIVEGRIKMIYSSQLMSEFLSVVLRPKMHKYFSLNEIVVIRDFIREHGEYVKPVTKVLICRDPEDNLLLSLSADGSADYLLTGDKDLLVLGKFRNTEIITFSDFKRMMKNKN